MPNSNSRREGSVANSNKRRRQHQPPPAPINHNSSLSTHWSPHRILSSNHQDLGTPRQVKQRFHNFLLYQNDAILSSILSILFSEPGTTAVQDFSLSIDAHEFLQQDPLLGNMLLRHPSMLLPLLEESIVEVQDILSKRFRDFQGLHQQRQISSRNSDPSATVAIPTPIVKGKNGTRVHARLIHLPPHSSNCKPLLSSLNSLDVDKILQISGTVVRTSKVQMYESQRAYRCVKGTGSSKRQRGGGGGGDDDGCACGITFTIKADLRQWNNALTPPLSCPTANCTNTTFEPVSSEQQQLSCSDYQEIKVQESFHSRNNHSNSAGRIPRALLVKLQHDLVDKCQPGDDVVVVGTLIAHWQQMSYTNSSDVPITMAMQAHSIRVVHGGEGTSSSDADATGSSNANSGGGTGSSSASSWDCIFEQGGGGETANEGVNEGQDRTKQSQGMNVREEIVKEFDDFWNQEYHRKNPIATRNFICQSVCPTLYGMSTVKLALLLTLIGGSSSGDGGNYNATSSTQTKGRKHAGEDLTEHFYQSDEDKNIQEDQSYSDDENDAPVQFHLGDTAPVSTDMKLKETHNKSEGFNQSLKRTEGVQKMNSSKNNRYSSGSTVQTRRREQSHLLLVGDPGTGKSQFLRFAAALCPRSVLTSGSGTTSAGLTCAAVREDSGKEFTLEAGALVLADRGVCAIDEFSCIAPKDRTTIHEAMEQQTLSVAKAGIVCKLNCRATVIAVTNAKGGIYDHDKSFTTNVGIEPPLLSRFDLIFKLIDGSNSLKDDNVATFLLNRAIQGAGYECTKISSNMPQSKSWGIQKLRAYIATVKSRFQPFISHDAAKLLERHYTACRSSETIALQITVRFLESLIRLAQAHARLMHRNTVEIDDAVSVIILMESSVASITSNCDFHGNCSLFNDPTTYVFPEDSVADQDFLLEKAKVLELYDMSNLLTPDEQHLVMQLNQGTQQNYNTDLYDNGWNTEHDHYGRQTQNTPARSPFNYSNSHTIQTMRTNDSNNAWDEYQDHGNAPVIMRRPSPD